MKAKVLKDIGTVATFIMTCEMAGFIGFLFTSSSIPEWYSTLSLPSFSPPDWIFTPVWIILFAIIGIADYLVWKSGFERAELKGELHKKEVSDALHLFVIQLTLNIFWTILFFGLRSPMYGFVEIMALWMAVAFTISSFFRISRKAGLLMIPYLVWISFVAILNFFIWFMN
jgi:benzodiazapine receptor